MRRNQNTDTLWVAANQNLEAKEYWLKKLTGEQIRKRFPYDRKEPVDQCKKTESKQYHKPDEKPDIPDIPSITAIKYSTHSFDFSSEVNEGLQKIAGNSDIKLHMILAAGLTVLVREYNAGTVNNEVNDIIIGTTIYKQDIEGEFVNTVLPLRTQFSPDQSFKQLLNLMKQTIMEAHDNYSYPMEILAEQLNLKPSRTEFPLFDTAIQLHPLQEKKHISHLPIKTIFTFQKNNDSTPVIKGKVEYDSAHYDSNTIQRIAGHYDHLLRQVLGNLDTPVEDIDILFPEEKDKLLVNFNDTGTDEAAIEEMINHSVVDQFEQRVKETPEAEAVVYKQEALTYRQLNGKVNQLAFYLRKKGVVPDSIVAVMMENPLDMLTAILAVWKAGGAYLPIGANYPQKRVLTMLDDSSATILLTDEKQVERLSFIRLQTPASNKSNLIVTPVRKQVTDIDSLQIPDRSLVNYEKYRPYIGQAVAKNSFTVQFSRGCVYNCAFCFKVWPHKYVVRSADNLFQEMYTYYQMGIRRFAFVDDLPNLDIKNASRLYEQIIKHNMKVHLHFPNGIRGDILTKDHIDLMVEAGTVNMDLALETTSPRLQKLIRKGLRLEKLYENIRYIAEKHPNVILELQIIHGLPTETIEEATASLDFMKSIRWLHFPYIHVLNIYPNSAMAEIAIKHGVSKEAIARSADIAYHELPETLPFPRQFTKQYQSEFVSQYFMCKERLLAVLPHQMKVLTEDELVQKYNSYLPVAINTFSDLLNHAGITRDEIKADFLPDDFGLVPDLNEQLKRHFRKEKPADGSMRLLLLDLTQYYSHETRIMYDVVEPPLGLMYLLSHLNRLYPGRINGKIAKSRIDFDNNDALKQLIREFDPHIIGIRGMNFYKEFFHKTVSYIRQWGIDVPIIAGGPYATSCSDTLLQDHNIDVAVLGEGEITLQELIGKCLKYNNTLPPQEELKPIPGLAFVQQEKKALQKKNNREVIVLEQAAEQLQKESMENPTPVYHPDNLAYIIYTSGSTGIPKGVLMQQSNLSHQMAGLKRRFQFDKQLQYMLLAAFTFDVSVMHISLSLSTGAKLYLLDDFTKKDPLKLWQFISDNKISVLNIVPAFMKAILENLESHKYNFEYLFVGGDEFKKELYEALKKTLKAERIMNIYGPTETTINALLYECPDVIATEKIPIGRPLPGYRAYILDKRFKPVPIGVGGELHIAGPGVARGYMNNPELTSKYFRLPPAPVNPTDSSRSHTSHRPISLSDMSHPSYRTGDLACWQEDGNIQFLGRIDHQVKIRGFRIELGEIERKLQTHRFLTDAVVVTRQDTIGDKYLAAYIVPQKELPEDINLFSQLKEHLAKELPEFMVPAHFVKLEKIPLNINGKLDEKALPAPERSNQKTYTAPRNNLENTLAELWADVIGTEKKIIGIDTNFFELGGHSLKATILISKIHKELNVKVPLVELFKSPTIRKFADFIRHQEEEHFEAVEPAEKKEYYPLSSAQKRLFFLQRMDKNNIGYNLPLVLPLRKDIEPEKLEAALKQLIARHESLRTSFFMVKHQPVQRVWEPEEIEFKCQYHVHHLDDEQKRGKKGTGNPGNLNDLNDISTDKVNILQKFIRPFDLAQAPLIRSGIIKINTQNGTRRNIWIVDVHHIISDGTSHTVLARDFMALYNRQELEPLKIQYKDFSQWQNRQLETGRLKLQEKYWLDLFKDIAEIPRLELPNDFKRPEVFTFAGNRYQFTIEKETAEQFKSLSTQEGATLYMNVLGIMNTLFYKYTGQTDIIIGTAIAGRRHNDLHHIIGMFVNTLAMRNHPEGKKTYRTLLKEIADNSLKAFENQDVQFEGLVDKLNPERDPSRSPLFDVSMVTQNFMRPGDDDRMARGDIPALVDREPMEDLDLGSTEQTTKFDMTFLVHEIDGQLHFDIEYYVGIFQLETIRRIARHFTNILNAVVETPDIRLDQIEYISDIEKQQLIKEFNNTTAAFDSEKTIHRCFEEQAGRIPHRTALIGPDGAHLTYGELNRRADIVAARLFEKGVRPDTITAITANRSPQMFIGIMGILKAGGAYLSIAPDLPQERIDYIVNDSNVKIILETSDVHTLNSESIPNTPQILKLDDLELDQLKSEQVSNFENPASEDTSSSLVYVIYTSGSTGRPKGVLVQHKGLLNLVAFHRRIFEENESSRISQVASASFDAMAFEMWPALAAGSALCIIDDETRMDPFRMKEWLLKHQITISFQSTQMAQYLLDEEWPETGISLKKIRTAGDRLTQYPAHPLPFQFYNLYGPTEDTVWTTWTEVPVNVDPRCKPPTIGKPAANKQVYILDSNGDIQPVGVTGELCIAGDGLARGYLNNPELTAEKFDQDLASVKDFTKVNSDHMSYRCYSSGDLARWLPDGNIEFVGRKDHQVKIRGYRIELGEIEAQLLTHPDVKEAVVQVIVSGTGDKYLCAYIVGEIAGQFAHQSELPEEELKRYLAMSMPNYMVPTYIMQLNAFPLTGNGKIDRKALPSPLLTGQGKYTAPRNTIEKRMAAIWADLLGIDENEIGIDAGFFQLGGHSIKAAGLAYRIREEFNVEIPLVELFRSPTIAALAAYTAKAKSGIGSKDDNLVLLKPGTVPENHLFMIHGGSGLAEEYIEFAGWLKEENNVWALQADKLENGAPTNRTIRDIARQYIDKIKTLQPTGAYRLAGWSIGGTIAFEMARQLERQNEKISFLAMFDSAPPDETRKQQALRFNKQSEQEIIRRFLPDPALIEQLNQQEDVAEEYEISRIWHLVMDYMEANNLNLEALQTTIPTDWLTAIQGSRGSGIREQLNSINTVRTLDNARNQYVPEDILNTGIHFFKARGQHPPADTEKWNTYTAKPLQIYEIDGDHYSIFKSPHAETAAKLFNRLLNSPVGKDNNK